MSKYTPGHMGLAMLRTVAGGHGFVCSTRAQQVTALRLHARRLLDRDVRLGHGMRFIGNEAGTKFIQQYDATPHLPPMAVAREASGDQP